MHTKEEKTEFFILLGVFAIEMMIIFAYMFAVSHIPVVAQLFSNILVRSLIMYALMMVPVLLYTVVKGDKFLASFGFKKVRAVTLLLTVLLVVAAYPMIMLANFVSQLFVPNTVVQAVGGMKGVPVVSIVLSVAVLAPFAEELVMRGFFANRFRKIIPMAATAILTGFLFGVLHMNLNQFCYAWVIGIIAAYVCIGSGSIYPSMLIHMIFNGFNVWMLFSPVTNMASDENLEAAQDMTGNAAELLPFIGVAAVLSVGSFFLVRFIIRKIAKIEGHLEDISKPKTIALVPNETVLEDFRGLIESNELQNPFEDYKK
ncbi:MAG: CPBP family intramembrane metalloprotease [Pseudobutyrivibrio sp.]|nr:CPBP family intramembrane metalloprotease [Pseudobutyrivibrio sp.]